MLMAQFQENGYVPINSWTSVTWIKFCKRLATRQKNPLFAAIGFGEIGAITVFNRLTEKERREEERAKAKAEAEELVKGWRG